MIPFLDLKAIQLEHRDALVAAFERVLQSGWYVLGQEVSSFEQEFAQSCQVSHCVGVANGLEAITLALRALGIGPGDEVIVPSNTYIATWLAVSHVGATPVPVEPVLQTYNLDPALIEAAITPRTKAVIPVHLYGQAADMNPILDIARRRGLFVIEDAAQAQGARYRDVPIGGHGDIVAWSFYPGKNLGAMGDAGAITTHNPAWADAIRLMRNYGSRIKYQNEVLGYNSRLDELQAALLRAKLPGLEDSNQRRRAVAEQYLVGLAGLEDLVLPVVPEYTDPVWHVFVVRHPRRDALTRKLAELGVATLIHYPVPPHLQPAYASMGRAKGSWPISELIHEQVFSLPISPVQTAEQTEQVVAAVRKAAAMLSGA